MSDATSIRRRLVGSSLRRYREDLGYDLSLAAQILECHPSKISRIETGQRGIRPKDLRELLTEYGVDDAAQEALTVLARRPSDPSWQYDHDKVLGSAHLEFLEVEEAASAIFIYAPVQIPRLLQTQEYAYALIAADPNIPEQARATLAAAELARRQVTLLEHHTRLIALIGEAALRHQIGSPEVTRAQLRHLIRVSTTCPEISIQILPFTAGQHASSGAGFSILQFSQVPALGLVHIDGPAGGVCIETPAAVAAYTRTFTHMQLSSLTWQEFGDMVSEGSQEREA